MGELIYLDERRADRPRPTRLQTPVFFFDLGCPHSYLTAERVERTLGEVEWVPVAPAPVHGQRSSRELEAVREQAHRRARALRLPLVWPEHFAAGATCALRAAALACELGAGESFALAAMRLHFCGGFDLDDPETLAEAAAASGVPLEDCLEAAGDSGLDTGLLATADGLRSHGVRELPAILIGTGWFDGEQALAAAATATAAVRTPSAYGSPLAPAG